MELIALTVYIVACCIIMSNVYHWISDKENDMYLEQQINTIVRTCYAEGVKANEVQTVVKAFYNGRIPSTNIMVLAIADTYGVAYDTVQEQEAIDRTKAVIEELRKG